MQIRDIRVGGVCHAKEGEGYHGEERRRRNGGGRGGCRAGCKALKLPRFIAAWTGLASLDSGWLPLKRGPYCW